MAPKTRSKAGPVWQRCEACQVLLCQKDIALHQDGSCPPPDDDWTHGFIRKKVLHSWLGELESADSLSTFPPQELENIVWMSPQAIRLCGFCIGAPVLVEAKNCLLVKTVWPTTEKSITSVLMTKSGLEFLSDACSAPVTVRKIPHAIPPAQEVLVRFQDDGSFTGCHADDVLIILQHMYSGKYLQEGSLLSIPYYGRKLKAVVEEIKTFPESEQNSTTKNASTQMETITEGLQNISFSEVKTETEPLHSTPVHSRRGSRRDQFEAKKRIPSDPSFNSPSSPHATPVRKLVRNMMEDSYAASSGEESREELSPSIDSFSESPCKGAFKTSYKFRHVVSSCDWRIKEVKKPVNEDLLQIDQLSSIGGLQNIIEELQEIMSLALGSSGSWQQGLKITRGVLLFGPSGTGKTMLANALARESKATVHILQGTELFSKVLGETDNRLRSFFSKATSTVPSVILLDEVDSLCSKKASSSGGSELERRVITTLCTILDSLSSENKKVFVIATTSRPDSIESSLRRPGRLDREIEVPVPTPNARLEILKKLLKPVPHSLSEKDLLSIAQAAHGFVGADISSLVSQAGTNALKTSKGDLNVCIKMENVQWALARVNPSAMREVLVDVPNVLWSDIGGQEDLKLKLKQAVEWPLSHPEAFERLGIQPPRGVLMFGPPGCSKTMIAKALATESKLNFLSIKGPELFSKWVGESERAVREVFRRARQVAPAIIFFDELDALGGERSSGSNGGGSNVQERVLAQLLTEMDGVTALGNVTVVAATNRPDRIDKALLRPGRLDRIVYVPLPDNSTRQQILIKQLQKMPVSNTVDILQLVKQTDGYSGAEVVAVCHEAALKALEEDISAKEVTNHHFEQALALVTPRTPPSLLKLYEDYLNR